VVYVSLFGPQAIGRLNPTANTLETWVVDSSPEGLAIDPHGVFYTLSAVSMLGILDLNVNVTAAWAVPTRPSWPSWLVSAPTGPGTVNLWFAERTAGKVGRYAPTTIVLPLYYGLAPQPQAILPRQIDIAASAQTVTPQVATGNPMLVPPIAASPPAVSGDFTEWTPVWGTGYVEGLTVAPDGQVWFSQAGPRLTVLDPASDSMRPYGLIAGVEAYPVEAAPTGEIWFGDLSRPALGRLDPATGDVTLWNIPFGVQPLDIAIDPLGDVWFSDRGAHAIYNFRPSTNEFVWWTLGGVRGPLYLALDGFGTVWFTEEGGNAISRLSVVPILGPPPVEEVDTSGFSFHGYSFNQRGNRATASVDYLYEGGGMGYPIYIGMAALTGGAVLESCVCELVPVNNEGFGTVELVLRYTGSGITSSDTIRFYVALTPDGDPVVTKDIAAPITWAP
jgi:streptogramin lyase